jgi:hypothetical protein
VSTSETLPELRKTQQRASAAKRVDDVAAKEALGALLADKLAASARKTVVQIVRISGILY